MSNNDKYTMRISTQPLGPWTMEASRQALAVSTRADTLAEGAIIVPPPRNADGFTYHGYREYHRPAIGAVISLDTVVTPKS